MLKEVEGDEELKRVIFKKDKEIERLYSIVKNLQDNLQMS